MGEDQRDVLQGFDIIPNFHFGAWRERIEKNEIQDLSTLVQGQHRCRYFNQPLTHIEEEERLSPHSETELWWWNLQDEIHKEYVTKSTQTDFRESETQTDPWDPPYTVAKSAQPPELLNIASFKYGKGLPVTSEELKDISYERDQKQLESRLPPITSQESHMKQRKMIIVEQKSKEVDRMKEKMRQVRHKKNKAMASMLQSEMMKREERKIKMLNNHFSTKAAELKEKSRRIRKQLTRELKRIDGKRSILTNNVPDVLDFPDDQPAARMSSSDSSIALKHGSHAVMPEHSYLSSAQGLMELEKWLWQQQKFDMQPEIFFPKKESRPGRLQKMIEQAEQDLMNERAKKSLASRKEVTFFRENRQERPVTPTAVNVPQDVLNTEASSILLQKLLRGRALQKEVLEVCDEYKNFIDEYWKINALSEEEQLALDEKRKQDIQYYLEVKNKDHQIATRKEVVACFEGEVINQELIVMGRGIQRYNCWKKVHKVVAEAKDTRRRREAAEAGRRQQEMLQQKTCDEEFSQTQISRTLLEKSTCTLSNSEFTDFVSAHLLLPTIAII